jgi:hypothetical protein
MANQAPDRREVLEMLAKVAVAGTFPGFSRWVFASEHRHEADALIPDRPPQYIPQHFSAPEYRTIEVLTELIIPRDETPGAKEAGVSEFIDFMAAHGENDLQKPMQDGLEWLEQASRKAHGSSFTDLGSQEQTALLEAVASKRDGVDKRGREFFLLIRRYTVMGYYTSPIGLEELSYPGLRFYEQSPACPHTNDPEHNHLPPPRF